MISLRVSIIRFLYASILKKILFCFDPEDVHDRMLTMGKILGSNRLTRLVCAFFFAYEHPILQQTIDGVVYKNPIGLAAGFDKNAELVDILSAVGFGFAEGGSITGEPCEGNAKPRLWRLPKSRALVVNYGLKNDGCVSISSRLRGRTFEIPIGISIAKTNCPTTVDVPAGIADYVKAFSTFSDIGAYRTINISCPNAFGGEPFTDPKSLDALLMEIDKLPSSKPTYIKISPDLSLDEINTLLIIIERHHVAGIICGNLTKTRVNPGLIDENIPTKGGISGKPTEDLSNALISHIWKKTKGKLVIIGCGGVFTAEDAYRKIRKGASLIQMITGMIYEGPQVIGGINRGLVELLQRDGFSNISEAVGVDTMGAS
ncbi:MAG: quinone-dependent dihydroorotate dehydrogenase [bacterium]|nr:quinone-dependent dihydroorotate dehydrogenase [bacterium]